MVLRIHNEQIVAIAPDGQPTPGTLAVMAVPDGLQAALYCHDKLYSTIHKNRNSVNGPMWDADDPTFLTYVCAVYAHDCGIVFDFASADLRAARQRVVSDDLAEHTRRILLTSTASGRPN